MRILSIALLSLLFFSCSEYKSTPENLSELAGGTLRYNEADVYSTLFPPSAKDLISTHIINQVHLGLVKYDVRNLSVLPGIADDWDVDNSGTVYTFKLNTKARFQDDECFEGGVGRRITAHDFKFTFEYLSKQSKANKNFFGTVDKILGAKEHYQASVSENPLTHIDGIEVVNDSVLQLTIDKPYSLFIYYLANPSASVLAPEAFQRYGENMLVGAGPFKITELPERGEPIVLERNPNYFITDEKGKALPYLDSIIVTFIGSPKKELRMFSEGELDMVLNVSSEHINDFLDAHISKFENNPPEYILTKSERLSNIGNFNILSSKIQNFNTNKMDNLDFSIVYMQEPRMKKKEEITE